MKKGKEILGVRSSTLHARVKAYVDAVAKDNVTISSVVRDAIDEKIARLEALLDRKRVRTPENGSAAPFPLAGGLIREAALENHARTAKEEDRRNQSTRASRKRAPDAP